LDLHQDDIPAVLDRLKEQSGCRELAHISWFKGFRTRTDGAVANITIEIEDCGPQAGSARWTVSAWDEDDNFATGDSDGRLEAAITGVEWFRLDTTPIPDVPTGRADS
jgi:hypothetical protein